MCATHTQRIGYPWRWSPDESLCLRSGEKDDVIVSFEFPGAEDGRGVALSILRKGAASHYDTAQTTDIRCVRYPYLATWEYGFPT